MAGTADLQLPAFYLGASFLNGAEMLSCGNTMRNCCFIWLHSLPGPVVAAARFCLSVYSNHNILLLYTQEDCLFQSPLSRWGLVLILVYAAGRTDVGELQSWPLGLLNDFACSFFFHFGQVSAKAAGEALGNGVMTRQKSVSQSWPGGGLPGDPQAGRSTFHCVQKTTLAYANPQRLWVVVTICPSD